MGGLMGDQEIAQFIKEIFDVNLTRDCFSKPNYEIISGLYEMFLVELGVDNWQQPELTALSNIENVERFDEFIPKCNLVNCLRHLLLSMGSNEDVTLADLVNPNPKKTRRIFTRLIQLWLRLSDLKQLWEPIAAEKNESEKTKDEMMRKLKSLKEESHKNAIFIAESKPVFHSRSKELNEISEKHDRLKLEGTELADSYQTKKQVMAEKKEKICDLDVELGEGKEEIKSLEMKIVKSPEKVMAEVNAKENELEEKRQESRKHQKEHMDCLKKMDVIQEAIRDMEPAIGTMRDTFSDLNGFREKTIERESVRSKIEAKKQEISTVRGVADQSEMNEKQLKDQKRKMGIQHENKIRPLKEMNEEIKQQIQLKQNPTSHGVNKDMQILLKKELELTNKIADLVPDRLKFDETMNNCAEKAISIVENFKNEALSN